MYQWKQWLCGEKKIIILYLWEFFVDFYLGCPKSNEKNFCMDMQRYLLEWN